MTKVVSCILVLLLALPISSCRREKTYRIGVSQCSSDDWRNKMNEEIYREIMLHPDAEVEIRSADDSNSKQIADIRYFKDNGFDIIIAAPNEADAITPIISEVYSSGIPVIVFDRDINGDTYTAWQGVDNTGMGRAAAQYAANLIGSGKVIEIYGLSGSTPAIERHAGFAEGCVGTGLEIVSTVYGNWNYEEAAAAVDSVLDIYPEVSLIYAHNDRMAIAASEVARSKGRVVRTIGIDAAPEIGIRAVADGVIDATFLYPTEGHRLVRTALAILKGLPYERNVRLPLSSAVDRTNADILLLQNESLKEETAKIRFLKSQVDDYWNRHSAQTTLFYAAIAIVILLFGLLFMILKAFWQHKRHQNELLEQNRLLQRQRDTEVELNSRLNAATQSKLMFFTNVSHDLRTPLTLISEPVEQLAAADNLTPRQHTLMAIANKNVKILHRLINQILDFRKFENGKLELNLTEADIPTLIGDWATSFEAVATKKHIKMTVDIRSDDGFTMAADVEKIERVVFNLMSNAFKYTPENGRITLSCRADGHNLVFSVKDNGRGISSDDIGKIFNRFYQVDKINPNGSGIGLSLVKAFVELHGGTIDVASQPDEGSVFTVTIPVTHTKNAADAAAEALTQETVAAELAEIEPEPAVTDSGLPLVLVIDDNSDIRLLVREILSDEYRIIEAPDGKEGLRRAAKYVPDLIISDVMMPQMDGMKFCRRIKGEVTTSHIPVLMLTACSMDQQRIQGYESGADGYLSKPFSAAMLRMRCRNLIENRKRICQLWAKPDAAPADATADADAEVRRDIDNEFYTNFLDLVKKEMGNAELNIDTLASSLGLGRSQFYRKIKALTNYSPVELLRKLRIERSRELLVSSAKTISEIAYEVGFSAPAYFTRVYRETYGETPSELRRRLAQ